MITLNGQNGGGQILRTALSLSMITGESFHIKNIRGQRKKTGLMRQHLACVRAATRISGATTDGHDIGSTELLFSPDIIRAGNYHFKIGSAGSTTLLAQTLIPALIRADEKSTVVIEGGTHNPLAPSACYLEKVFLPQLQKMGAQVSIKLNRHGFAPAGAGSIKLSIHPCNKICGLHLIERGKELSRDIVCHLAHIKDSVALREIKTVRKVLAWKDAKERTVDASDSSGPGNCLSIINTFENVSTMTTTHGAHGVTSERVARNAAKSMGKFIKSDAVADHHLADQLLLPMALAGEGSMITTAPTNHILTNIKVIQQFLDVSIEIENHTEHLHRITIGA